TVARVLDHESRGQASALAREMAAALLRALAVDPAEGWAIAERAAADLFATG
ncbi:MAG: hypothetical protein JHD15_03060, partial [Phenylobacterium sp.]|nr:hypothetical protein [Phenylobacterium sp.]